LFTGLGPYIAVFKTHIDIVADFDDNTVDGLKTLAEKHNFLIFEDRKFVDIGNTVQMQYHGGALRISEWAHLVNASILAGEGIVQALSQTYTAETFPYHGSRGLLLLAEMTTKGSLATGEYTKLSVDIARKNPAFVVGFVATQVLSSIPASSSAADEEDFVVFTTGVNRKSAGDSLGQQYQTPAAAVSRGADFIIAGRGIYAASDPVESVKLYQKEGWEAYLERVERNLIIDKASFSQKGNLILPSFIDDHGCMVRDSGRISSS
jgi:orotidine-5'-phosphate decarboxylase